MNDCIQKDYTCAAYCDCACPMYYPQGKWISLKDMQPPMPSIYRVIFMLNNELYMPISPVLWDGYEFKPSFDYEEILFWTNS